MWKFENYTCSVITKFLNKIVNRAKQIYVSYLRVLGQFDGENLVPLQVPLLSGP